MNLQTTYLGLKLDHPIVASASPLSREFDGIRRLEDAGAAAVVMPSIYEEEIVAEDTAYTELVEQGSFTQPEAAGGYFPELTAFRVGGLEARVETLRRAVDSCAIPIIASLNGSTPEGWTTFAHDLEQAGAAAIELNLYRVPTDPRESSADVEKRWVDTVRAVCLAVNIPVAVKLGSWLSSPANHAMAIAEAGAKGLVLFNRFYEPDIDLLDADAEAEPGAEQPLRDPPGAAVDLAAFRPHRRLAGGDQRRGDRRRGGQVPARRRRRGDDRLGAAPPRAAAHRNAAPGDRSDGSRAAASTASTTCADGSPPPSCTTARTWCARSTSTS